VGVVAGQPGAGALGGLGALYCGIASYGGVYRARLRMMLGSAAATTLATALGTAAGQSTAIAIVATFLCGLVAALYAASSPKAATIGVQACAVLVVFSGLGLPPSSAIANAATVLAGAGSQILLLSAVWPFTPSHPERAAVADAIDSLAAFVLDHATDRKIPASQLFQDARGTLDQVEQPLTRREHELLVRTVQRAESVRAALVGWARADEAYRSSSAAAATRTRRIRRLLHRSLRRVASSVRRYGTPDAVPVDLYLPRIASDDPVSAEFAHWVSILETLVGYLMHGGRQVALAPASERPRPRAPWFSMLTRLPNVPSLRSLSMEHAYRYAVTLTAATAIYRASGVWHGYWFPLTVALVLRPDYGTTFVRGVARLFGTLGGVALAGLLIDLTHPAPAVLLGLVVAASWFVFALFQTGYAAYSLAITVYVVFSVSASGVATREIGVTRLVATVAGVAFALVAYRIWPALHWKKIWEVLRDAIAAQLEYADVLLHADGTSVGTSVDEARVRARGLRMQAETLLLSASLDPLVRGSRELESAKAATEQLDESAAEMLRIEATHAAGDREIGPKMNAVIATSRNLESSIRHKLSDYS
jgi:uncharacterized membrane protein YccC